MLFYLFSFAITLAVPLNAHAVDLNFRFKDGYCQKKKHPGFNPNHQGECGNLANSHFINKKFTAKSFRGANFNSFYSYYADFSKKNMSHTSLRRSTILQSQFSNISGNYLDLRGAYLKATDWSESSLQELLATGTRFINVSFKGCDLRNANFWGALLQNVDFRKSDLRGANLELVALLMTQFKGAQFNNKTKLPFSKDEALKRGMIEVD